MYLHILKHLNDSRNENRSIAFYHRNSSKQRKEAILADLKLPLNSPGKVIQCVVATVSLGMTILLIYGCQSRDK